MGPREIASIINVAVELDMNDFDYISVDGRHSKLSHDLATFQELMQML